MSPRSGEAQLEANPRADAPSDEAREGLGQPESSEPAERAPGFRALSPTAQARWETSTPGSQSRARRPVPPCSLLQAPTNLETTAWALSHRVPRRTFALRDLQYDLLKRTLMLSGSSQQPTTTSGRQSPSTSATLMLNRTPLHPARGPNRVGFLNVSSPFPSSRLVEPMTSSAPSRFRSPTLKGPPTWTFPTAPIRNPP